ncbi:hypothetical protein CAOG_07814 [Capsaspora owczarzaki ATCC 30864]|uniref:hypothetical protein n=1 Tax=Capsaspora owczarzaki (strain ATCC 30864) TaxID=595528 RepID=UPI0001FE3491|nr:hypothetical protein CAOG_07814 [Capsaspora owczarzaki ATCC 30864]|eukprot:XP_004342887.1 hypothetical protein CAOG_07814 [Capsaspora owczarzaki ATCC 30864]
MLLAAARARVCLTSGRHIATITTTFTAAATTLAATRSSSTVPVASVAAAAAAAAAAAGNKKQTKAQPRKASSRGKTTTPPASPSSPSSPSSSSSSSTSTQAEQGQTKTKPTSALGLARFQVPAASVVGVFASTIARHQGSKRSTRAANLEQIVQTSMQLHPELTAGRPPRALHKSLKPAAHASHQLLKGIQSTKELQAVIADSIGAQRQAHVARVSMPATLSAMQEHPLASSQMADPFDMMQEAADQEEEFEASTEPYNRSELDGEDAENDEFEADLKRQVQEVEEQLSDIQQAVGVTKGSADMDDMDSEDFYEQDSGRGLRSEGDPAIDILHSSRFAHSVPDSEMLLNVDRNVLVHPTTREHVSLFIEDMVEEEEQERPATPPTRSGPRQKEKEIWINVVRLGE